MKRNNTEKLGDVIMQLLRQEGRLIDSWKDVVGPAIFRHTTNIYIKNQTLYVQLSSSVIRQELQMGRELLIKNLNSRVGAQVITNIIFC